MQSPNIIFFWAVRVLPLEEGLLVRPNPQLIAPDKVDRGPFVAVDNSQAEAAGAAAGAAVPWAPVPAQPPASSAGSLILQLMDRF